MYKFLTSAMSQYLLQFMIREEVLPRQQRALRNGVWGTYDCLLMDQAVAQDAKKRRRDLQVLWYDFKKGYNLVPHEWVLRACEAIGVSEWFVTTMRRIVSCWSTRYSV